MTTLTNIHSIRGDWLSYKQRLSDLVMDTKSTPNLAKRVEIQGASKDVYEIVLQVKEILSTYEQVEKKHKSEMIRASLLSSVDTLCFSLGALGLISSLDQDTKDTYPWLEGVSIGALAVSQLASKVNDYFHLKRIKEERKAHQNLKILEEILNDPIIEKMKNLFGISQTQERVTLSLSEAEWSEKKGAFLLEQTRSLTLSIQDEMTPLVRN